MSTLYYEFAWDIARIGALAVKVTDTHTFEVRITTGRYSHSTVATTNSGNSYTKFATTLAAALTAGSTGAGGATTYTVTWTQSTQSYQITSNTTPVTLSFTTVTTAAEGTRMQHILGMTGNRSGGSSYSSQCRPYYSIVPVTAGRSNVDGDYEPDAIAQEQVADDGSAYAIAVSTSPKLQDWQQVGDQNSPSSAYTQAGLGTPVQKPYATSAVPWTWEDAFEHHRNGFDVIDVADSFDRLIVRMRGNKCSFHPQRMGGADYDLWRIPFAVRVLGRS